MRDGYLICSRSGCSHCQELISLLQKKYNPKISETEEFNDGVIAITHDIQYMRSIGIKSIPTIFLCEVDNNNKATRKKTITVDEFKKKINI